MGEKKDDILFCLAGVSAFAVLLAGLVWGVPWLVKKTVSQYATAFTRHAYQNED
jgi:hypothetical protein